VEGRREASCCNAGCSPSPSRPLQDLPCRSLQGSVSARARRTSRRRSKGLSDGLDAEGTPTELIQQRAPLRKQPRLGGKENEGGLFVLARRSRRRRESPSCRRPLRLLLSASLSSCLGLSPSLSSL